MIIGSLFHPEHTTPYRARPLESPSRAPTNDQTRSAAFERRRPPRAEGYQPPKRGKTDTCHACHREGHLALDCPSWKNRCYRCHGHGHTSKACNLPDQRRKNVPSDRASRPTRLKAPRRRRSARYGGVPYVLEMEGKQDQATWGDGVHYVTSQTNHLILQQLHQAISLLFTFLNLMPHLHTTGHCASRRAR